MKVKKYLIVSANGDARVVTRSPRLAWDEVAFPLEVTVPDTWGRLYRDRTIEVAIPGPAEGPEVAVGGVVQPDSEVPDPGPDPERMEA